MTYPTDYADPHEVYPIDLDPSDLLKPCPFCGNSDVIESDIKEVHPTFGISGYAVWCGNCGAYGGSRNEPDLAVKAWNRRAKDE